MVVDPSVGVPFPLLPEVLGGLQPPYGGACRLVNDFIIHFAICVGRPTFWLLALVLI